MSPAFGSFEPDPGGEHPAETVPQTGDPGAGRGGGRAREPPLVDDEVGLQPGQLGLEVFGVDLVERVRRPERAQPVGGQWRVHLLAG